MPTPWPSWTIACSKAAQQDKISKGVLTEFQTRLQQSIKDFTSLEKAEASQAYIEKHFSYKSEDVAQWWSRVRWVQDNRGALSGAESMNGQSASTTTVSKGVLTQTLDLLEKAGVVHTPDGGWRLNTFAEPERLSE